MTLTTGQDEQVTEFRVGTVNDLLLAAKGGTTDSAADAKRFKSLALAGGVSSAVLALALVVVLITGTGSKSSSKSSTTATTLAPLAAPANYNAVTLPFATAQAAGLKQGQYVTIAGQSRDQTRTIEVPGCLLLAVTTTQSAPVTKGIAPTASTTLSIAVPKDKFADFNNLDRKNLTVAVEGSSPSTAPPATQPPATQPATTPPSS